MKLPAIVVCLLLRVVVVVTDGVYSSSVVPPDPSVHFYHWGQDQSSMEMLTTLY